MPPAWAKPLSVPLCTIHFSLCRPHPPLWSPFVRGPGSVRAITTRPHYSPARAIMRSPSPGVRILLGPSHLITIITATAYEPAPCPVLCQALYIHYLI